MGRRAPHKRQILNWPGQTAGGPGDRAPTSASGDKEEMVRGEAGRKRTLRAAPGAREGLCIHTWEPPRTSVW